MDTIQFVITFVITLIPTLVSIFTVGCTIGKDIHPSDDMNNTHSNLIINDYFLLT